MSARPSRGSPLKRILWAIYWIIFAIALVIVLGYAAFKLFINEPEVPPVVTLGPSASQSVPPINSSEPDPSEEPSQIVLTRREGVFTCLLAGTDEGDGRTDTLMLGVFDTQYKMASLISIPRDTLVQVNGKDQKINAVYAIGGIELTCQVVSETLAVPVDYYAVVQLQAFEDIVNEIGGVWFTVPQDMKYDDPFQDLHIDLKEGYQLLNGEQAVHLMRFRHGYQSQDIGRSQTQRAFLAAMVKQTITLSNADKVTSLIKILEKHVDSNMPLDTMIYFATQAIGMNLTTDLKSAVLPGDWIYPVIELRDEEVLTLINSLGIYETPVPLEGLNIHHKANVQIAE